MEGAQSLADELKAKLTKVHIELSKTERAGHAVELAKSAVKKYPHPLIISVSGDGGYHEVVNGAMAAGKPFIGAVYPAGNANDHRRATKRQDLVGAIIKGKVTSLDLLRAQITHGNKTYRVYAHSYIGLGITPVVAVELNRHTLTKLKEMMLVLRTFHGYRPFEIKLRNGAVKRFNSLVFANIPEMAKFLTLSAEGKPTDGKFEIISWPDSNKLKIAALALKAIFSNLGKQPQAKRFSFTTLVPMPMQLDGEVVELKKGSGVEVIAAPGALKTIR